MHCSYFMTGSCLLATTVSCFYFLREQRMLRRARSETTRLALVAKLTDNGVVITDTQGRIEWVNEGFTKISGYHLDEVIGKTPGSFLQRPNSNLVERARIRECIRSGTGFEAELTNYCKTGCSYVVHLECQPLVDPLGTVTGFMSIQRDVTHTRRSSNLMEAVAATSTMLLAKRLDPPVWAEILSALGKAAAADRCYLFCIHAHPQLGTPALSQVAEWNSGSAPPQIQNPQLQNFSFHDNGYDRWLPELQAGRVICGTVQEFPASEQPMLIAQEIRSLVVVPIFTDQQLYGFLGFDACGEERLWQPWEIAILRSAAANIGLRRVVQDEADALVIARDAAHEAALAAETASRARSTFLATMSHEIRTPLNAIIGMASLLESTPLNAQQQDFTQTLLGSSHLLLEVLTDILDYSHIESGNVDLVMTSFALSELCHEVCDAARPGAKDKAHDLSCHVAATLPCQVVGDRARLKQILVHVLDNAVKFTPGGFVSLNVDGQLAANGLWRLAFEIKDSGIGMLPEAIGGLFKPFEQADSATTRRFGGTGLGLAISKRLAEAMGGDLSVSSVYGEGSTFTCSLHLKGSSDSLADDRHLGARPANAGQGECGTASAARPENSMTTRTTTPPLHSPLADPAGSLPVGVAPAAVSAAAADPSRVLIDVEQLNTFIDLGSAGYFDILGDLLLEVPAALDALRGFVATGDTPAFKRRTHSLKGVLGCFGCVAIRTRLDELESQEATLPAQAEPLHARNCWPSG